MSWNSNPLIFIVDDDPIFHRLIKSILNINNFTNILSCFTGEDCIERLSEQPNYIFLDYNLDGLNGLDVLEKIKSQCPNTHVIMISAQEKIDVAVNALKLGATDYIIKDNTVFSKLRKWANSVMLTEENNTQLKSQA